MAERVTWGGEERRFFPKVRVTADCWEWTASLDGKGYGQFSLGPGYNVRAHRWSYEFHQGAIPDGLTLDHLCRNRKCVRPDHLEPVSTAVNNQRASGWSTGFCQRGHDVSDTANVLISTGGQRCRPCHNQRQREFVAARRSA